MRTLNYDVVVVGGGSAGVAAALASSRNGSKTLLVERAAYFGGEATNSWVSAYCGFYTKGEKPTQCVYGIGDEVLKLMEKHGEDTNYVINPSTKNASVRFHPETIKIVLDELLESSDVDYRLCTSLIDVKVEGNKIQSVIIIDDEDKCEVYAQSFVDTTGDANMIHMAGLKTMWGNEEFGIQQSSLSCLVEGIPSGEVKIETLESAIKKGKEEGLENLHKERGMIVKVKGDDYGYLTIPSVILDNLSGEELTKKLMDLRKQARDYVKAIKDHAPGFEKMRFLASAPYIGIRESRRMMGKVVITGEDVLNSKKCDDTIGRGGWPAEMHKASGLQFVAMKENDYFDIPIGALLSKDIENLFTAGRSISCESVALASLRVMGTGFASGQAAGVIASVYALDKDVDTKKVQTILKAQNALL